MRINHQPLHAVDRLPDKLWVLRLKERQVKPDLQAVHPNLLDHFEGFLVVAGDLRVSL